MRIGDFEFDLPRSQIAQFPAEQRDASRLLVLGRRSGDVEHRNFRELPELLRPSDLLVLNDAKVIAGQGTVGLEMGEAHSDLEEVVVPVGGGGLASGVAVAMKAINPKVRIIGVQSEAYPTVYEALRKQGGRGGTAGGSRAELGETLADGIAVKQPGKITLQLLEKYLDGVVLVSDAEIAKAIFLLLERAKTVAEPAGAAGLAAVLSGAVNVRGKKCAVVISGGNIDMYTLDQTVAKGLEMEHRLLRLEFTLPDRPGALREIIDAVAEAKANIVEVTHERMGSKVPLGRATVILSVETQNSAHTKDLVAGLTRTKLRYKVLA